MAAAGEDGPPEDEADAWRAATEDTRPLRAKSRAAMPGPAAPPLRPRPKVPLSEVGFPEIRSLPDLAVDSGAGLDRRTFDRLRKGTLPIDARLDLHGLREEAAHARLVAFLQESVAARRRCVQIITGKGRDGAGVLKQRLPQWLNGPELRPAVISIAQAPAAHGGSGAFVLWLRKPR